MNYQQTHFFLNEETSTPWWYIFHQRSLPPPTRQFSTRRQSNSSRGYKGTYMQCWVGISLANLYPAITRRWSNADHQLDIAKQTLPVWEEKFLSLIGLSLTSEELARPTNCINILFPKICPTSSSEHQTKYLIMYLDTVSCSTQNRTDNRGKYKSKWDHPIVGCHRDGSTNLF